jgi:hypothetical protein
MLSIRKLRARASQFMTQAASEPNAELAANLREMAVIFEQLAKQREMTNNSTKAILDHRQSR